ncbi:hypothetical protein FUA48_08550 [Flavobacterium alkalisoli]|uniref:Uncharacterized protein n=1 Tax=Flavobacterium alkalisoli TaxID=2602769 RepID=A0A5B9FRL4_9FLAO|nr:hypothetical protein [Flavobacterium alkalisoli]QEE49630.1 hypothetical protein FUA48_08550 [Flavobacterium alkalisoli]
MDDFNLEQKMREAAERDARMKKREDEAVADITKYFDRIHDYISNYNNLLIGAFFALAQFQENISRWTILFPVLNLWFLILINYRQMENARFLADINNKPVGEVVKYGKSISRTNGLSLLAILSTLIVTVAFLCYLAAY